MGSTTYDEFRKFFEKSKQELMLIQDMIISAFGASKLSAEYGAYVMRELGIFDTIKVQTVYCCHDKRFSVNAG